MMSDLGLSSRKYLLNKLDEQMPGELTHNLTLTHTEASGVELHEESAVDAGKVTGLNLPWFPASDPLTGSPH